MSFLLEKLTAKNEKKSKNTTYLKIYLVIEELLNLAYFDNFLKMVRSCQAFLNRHEDTLEEALVRKFHHKMGVWLCHELSDACR